MTPISEKIIATLEVPAKGNRRYYFSGAVLSGKVAPRGFNVCVTAAGVVSFALYHRPHQETIGKWDKSPGGGDTSLIGGILRAKERAAALANGADPRPARTKRQQTAAVPEGETVASVVDRYIDRMKRDRKDFRTLDQVESSLTRFVKPLLGKLPAYALRRKDVADMLDRVADDATPLMADRCLHHFAAAWRWANKRDEQLPMPFVSGMRRTNPADQVRTRVLDDGELVAIWAATTDGSPFSRYVRFLLLSAARRAEAMLFWNELDVAKGIWTLPASRNKVKFDLVRPLSKSALGQLIMNGEERAFYFTNGLVTRQHCALLKRSDTKDWRLHDLRRTARTLLSRAGVATEVAERALGHRPPVIERTYNQHGYDDELRLAYESLARLIQQLATPQENVVAMRGR